MALFIDKLLLTWISRFLRNQPYHLWVYNQVDTSLCLNDDCFGLFHKLSLAWSSKFLWKQPYISLQWGWCLLRNDVIKIGKFVFVWMVIVFIQTVVDVSFKVFVEGTIYETIIMLFFIAYWRHQNREISVYVRLISSAYLKNCCGQKVSKFKNYLWINNHVDACCLMKSSEKKFLFNTDSFCYLINLWWLEFSNFFGRGHLWTYDDANIYDIRYQNKKIFSILVSFFFVWENIDDLKLNTFFLGGGVGVAMINKTIMTIINSWKRHQKLNCVFKSMVSFVYLISTWSSEF